MIRYARRQLQGGMEGESILGGWRMTELLVSTLDANRLTVEQKMKV